MNNIGFYVARLNNLVRELNKITASSFVDKGDVYENVTNIIIEADHIRKLNDKARFLVLPMDDVRSNVHNIMEHKK